MKNYKKLLAVLLALCLLAAMATVLSACGSEKENSKSAETSGSEQEDPYSPEGVVEDYLKAFNDRDAEKIVDLSYSKPEQEHYKNECDEDKNDLINNLKEGFENRDRGYGDDWKFKDIQIKKVNDVKGDEFKSLQKVCEDEYDMKITDAKVVNVSFTIGGKDYEEDLENELTVYKYDGKWYLY